MPQTIFEKAGYKVGDQFKVVDTGFHFFPLGAIVTLTDIPMGECLEEEPSQLAEFTKNDEEQYLRFDQVKPINQPKGNKAMSKISILFTAATLAEMQSRQAPVPADFTGPVFESATLDFVGDFVEVATTDEVGNVDGPVYLYPSSSIARIKVE